MKAVSGRELARILERKGWQLLRVHGSHFLYGRSMERIVIPVHGNKTLKTGMQRDLMKQAGLEAGRAHGGRLMAGGALIITANEPLRASPTRT